MKNIALTKGLIAVIDDDDYERVSAFKWHASFSRKEHVYASSGKAGSMHRFITSASKGTEVDHINHNTLDNRKSNLRICTRSENQMNARKRRGPQSSKYKGVYPYPLRTGVKWRVLVTLNTKIVFDCIYDTEEQAAIAYNSEAVKFFGKFAFLNKV